MSLFKNEVGRPSNETIKKRRIIATIMIFAVVLAIGGCVFYTVNYFKGINSSNKNISSNQFKICNGLYYNEKVYGCNSLAIRNNSGRMYTTNKKIQKGEFDTVNWYATVVELASSNKASLTIQTKWDKNIIKGKGKYYYQIQVFAYDSNDKVVAKSNKVDIKKETIVQNITIGSTVKYLKLKYYDATKKHKEFGGDTDLRLRLEPKILPSVTYSVSGAKKLGVVSEDYGITKVGFQVSKSGTYTVSITINNPLNLEYTFKKVTEELLYKTGKISGTNKKTIKQKVTIDKTTVNHNGHFIAYLSCDYNIKTNLINLDSEDFLDVLDIELKSK